MKCSLFHCTRIITVMGETAGPEIRSNIPFLYDTRLETPQLLCMKKQLRNSFRSRSN